MSLVISPTAPVTPAPGWLSVQSDTRLELRERGKLIGTTETEQLMLPAGAHDIELVNEAIGYRSSRQDRGRAGQDDDDCRGIAFRLDQHQRPAVGGGLDCR